MEEDKPLVKKILKPPYYTVIYIEWEKFKQFKEIFKPVKKQIEAKQQTCKLQAGLAANIAEGDRKQKQQNALIAQLNQEKKTT